MHTKFRLNIFQIKEIIIHHKSLQTLKYQYIVVAIKHKKYEFILNINSDKKGYVSGCEDLNKNGP